MPPSDHLRSQIAIFGGGCFWCTEAVFSRLKGVLEVIPGYAGGHLPNPTYEQVSQGQTGHAEVIKISFDPEVISYQLLLDIFWDVHDPTTLNQQGADKGTQYRSIILATSNEQESVARSSKAAVQQHTPQPIVTTIQRLTEFYTAEEYHRRYYDLHPDLAYCDLVISPKLEKIIKKYTAYLK